MDFRRVRRTLPPDKLTEAGLAQFPLVIGGIVPVVNVEGVEAGQLHFTGPLLADIYLRNIKRWNDPALVAANPGVTLPDQAITVGRRPDGACYAAASPSRRSTITQSRHMPSSMPWR